MRVGSMGWFAQHEWRLAWRDFRMLMISQRRGRTWGVILGVILLTGFLHLIASIVLHPAPELATEPSKRALVLITAAVVLAWSLMLSQAMEAVTRAFYARADLELILSSPVTAWRLFAVRIGAMTVTVMLMSLVLSASFINVLAWRSSNQWLAAYPATMALAMLAVAMAIVITATMFKIIGPKQTRLIAQIVAALIGAIFIIGLQFAAILSYGTMNRLAFLESEQLTAIAPATDSPLWVVTYALMGHTWPFIGLVVVAILGLAGTIMMFAPRFGAFAIAAAGVAQGSPRRGGSVLTFRNTSPAQSLRRKEWALLRRDPWLVSQTLVQILYLLPAAYLLWSRFETGISVVTLLVPILITAAGQFAGGLAWLAISDEDAPELIRTAPVPPVHVLRAKVEAVLGGTILVFSPFLVVLTILSPRGGLVAALGVLVACSAATAIQYWYRAQAHRSRIRRRQTASRLTTFAEAMSSISWAATGALAAAGLWLALVPGVISCLVVAAVWWLSPSRGAPPA